MKAVVSPAFLRAMSILVGTGVWWCSLPAEALIAPGNEAASLSEDALQKALRGRGVPVAFPYWRHVGQIERSTGIYLGGGYVLTAAHVGAGTFRSWDGRVYGVAADSIRFFRNRNGSTADLCLFRIRSRPGDPIEELPPMVLTSLSPRRGRELLLLGGGAGGKRGASGFAWGEDYRIRWGLNAIAEIYSVPLPTHQFASYGFATRFEASGERCQAAPGDSGGAAFHFNAKMRRWELAGVIVAVDSEFGEAKYGNQTYIADPALFRRDLAQATGGPGAVLAVRP